MNLITKSKLILQPDKNNVNQENQKVLSDMRALACYVWLQSVEYLNARIFVYFHTRLHLKCLLMSFLKVDKKTSKSFPSFIRCMLRIELYWAVVKRKATNCFVPLVKPKQNGYASGISLRECFLMTRPPIWRDSWIKRTEKWAFLCCQLEAARQNRIPPTWPSEANLLLSYEICWLCGLSRSDTAEEVDYGYSAEFRGYNNIEDQYVCLVAAFVGGRSSDVWTKRTISSWLFAGKQMKSWTWISAWAAIVRFQCLFILFLSRMKEVLTHYIFI